MSIIDVLILLLLLFAVIAIPTGLVLLIFKAKRPLGKRALLVGFISIVVGLFSAYSRGDQEAREAGWTSALDKQKAKEAGFSDPQLWHVKVEADQAAAAAAKTEADRAAEAARAAKAEADRVAAAAKAQVEQAAAQQAAVQKRSKANAEEMACREDIQCWGDKNSVAAALKCDDYIEQLAKYSFEWTDKWYEPKFSHFRWKNKAAGHVTYMGDKIKFQNGFGAFQIHAYTCDFDPTTKAVLDVSARPGRL